MGAGDPNRPGLGVQPIVERRADRHHAAARAFARFEHDDLAPCTTQEISRAQAGESRADDDDWISGVRRFRLGGPLQQRRHGWSRQGRELEKPSTSKLSSHCGPAAEPPF